MTEIPGQVKDLALGACCTCGFFALDAAKNLRLSGSFGSLQCKKSPKGDFWGLKCAKRNKLLGCEFSRAGVLDADTVQVCGEVRDACYEPMEAFGMVGSDVF